VCPTPEIYPGSTSYENEVYSTLSKDIAVRNPTPCPWSDDKHEVDKAAPESELSPVFAEPQRAKASIQATWTFHIMDNGGASGSNDLMAISMGPTDSGKVELRIHTGITSYALARKVVTGLTYQPSEWAFEVLSNSDILAINMGPTTNSGMTEVHILTAKSDYKKFALHTATALNLPDKRRGEWAFGLLKNNDLVAIRKGPSQTGRTELKILSSKDSYRTLVGQAVTALGSTDLSHGLWSFQVMKWRSNDLMAIKVGTGAEAGRVELRILTSKSNYGEFSSKLSEDSPVLLPLRGGGTGEFYFHVLPNGNLMSIRRESGKFTQQILTSQSNYGDFLKSK